YPKDKAYFYQKLETNTEQKMKVTNQEINQKQSQTFYIKWTVKEKSKDGNWVVTQKIEGVEMRIEIGGNVISYSSLKPKDKGQNPMTEFFDQLTKLELTLTIAPDLTVKSIDGRKEFIDKLAQTNPQMQKLLDSILSEAALKQMSEPTWG